MVYVFHETGEEILVSLVTVQLGFLLANLLKHLLDTSIVLLVRECYHVFRANGFP